MKYASYEVDMNYRLYREFFRAVANPVRFGIVERLRRGPAPVGDLAAELRLEQSHVSHALACLLQCGFVLRSAEGAMDGRPSSALWLLHTRNWVSRKCTFGWCRRIAGLSGATSRAGS